MSYESTKKPWFQIPILRRGSPSIGLGDAIKQGTASIGIVPCGGCKQRAAWLNQRLVFVGRKR